MAGLVDDVQYRRATSLSMRGPVTKGRQSCHYARPPRYSCMSTNLKRHTLTTQRKSEYGMLVPPGTCASAAPWHVCLRCPLARVPPLPPGTCALPCHGCLPAGGSCCPEQQPAARQALWTLPPPPAPAADHPPLLCRPPAGGRPPRTAGTGHRVRQRRTAPVGPAQGRSVWQHAWTMYRYFGRVFNFIDACTCLLA